MEVLPPSGTSCIRQWLITSRSQWCIWDALMFYKKISFCFVYLSFFFLYVCVWFILFPMMLNDDACTHLHGVTECVRDIPLPAASGAAGSGEADRKGLLDIWDCSSNLHCKPLPFWDVAYPSLLSLTCEQREWLCSRMCPPGLKNWLRNFPALPWHFYCNPSWGTWALLKSSADLYGFLMMLMCVLRCFVFQLKY